MKIVDIVSAFAVMVCAILSQQTFAAVEKGGNVFFNPALEKDQSELPIGWVSPGDGAAPHVIGGYAPENATAFVFRGADSERGITVRQMDIGLVPGAEYRLSFKAKTAGFRNGTALCVIANAGWVNDAGVRKFPENSDWTSYSKDFVCMPRVVHRRGNDRYQLIIFTGKGFEGEIAFSHLKLEPLDAAAVEGTERMRLPEVVTRPRIIPLRPLLHRIDREDPRITVAFRNFDKSPASGLSVRMTIGDAVSAVPFREELTFDLLSAPDRGTFALSVIENASGRELSRREFSYSKIAVRFAADPVPRPLNNYVAEIMSVKTGSAAEESFRFTLAKPGWVYLRFESAAGKQGGEFGIYSDGKAVIGPSTPGLETVRFMEAGGHVLDVRGAPSGTMTVRSIGEIYYYSPLTDNQVSKMPKRTWERFVRDVLPNVTTVGGSRMLSDAQAAHVRAAGRRTQMFFPCSSFKTAGEFDKALRTSPAMTLPRYDTAMLDEQFFDRPELLGLCTDALWDFNRELPDFPRLISVATTGNPASGHLDTDYLSAVANSSKGFGEVAVEAYYRTKATEKEAHDEIYAKYGKTVTKIRNANPHVDANVLIMLGVFTQYPVLSLLYHPEVDYRYYLDMQMQAIATAPVFRGLKGVGVWGSGYSDEELHFWMMKLMRHYFIEGRTTLLSKEYGLKYLPGFVVNGDFRGGLSGWEVAGGVRHGRHPKLGRDILKRWWAPGGLGNEYALFVRGKEPGRLRQELKGLEPGRVYRLEFITFDPREVKSGKPGRRRHPLSGVLGSGARVVADRSWTWVDERIARKGRGGVGFVNLHHTVFVAESDTVAFTLDDGAAAEGDEIGVNSISVSLAFTEDVAP